MTKKEIRKMLHPTLGEDYLPATEEKMGPGIKSLNSLYASMFHKSKKRLHTAQRPFCRVKEFKRMPKYDLDVPVVRNSSAYTTAEETRRKEDLVSVPKG